MSFSLNSLLCCGYSFLYHDHLILNHILFFKNLHIYYYSKTGAHKVYHSDISCVCVCVCVLVFVQGVFCVLCSVVVEIVVSSMLYLYGQKSLEECSGLLVTETPKSEVLEKYFGTTGRGEPGVILLTPLVHLCQPSTLRLLHVLSLTLVHHRPPPVTQGQSSVLSRPRRQDRLSGLTSPSWKNRLASTPPPVGFLVFSGPLAALLAPPPLPPVLRTIQAPGCMSGPHLRSLQAHGFECLLTESGPRVLLLIPQPQPQVC